MRLYDKVIKICGTTDFMKGLNYQANKIKLIKMEDTAYLRRLILKVTSERINRDYDVQVLVDKDDETINDYSCTCPQYEKMDTCKHIAAAILKYQEELFMDDPLDPVSYQLNIGSQILDKFYDPKNPQ